ncbi:MAG: heavy metal translocating P-type ATPase [Bacillota bacterium]
MSSALLEKTHISITGMHCAACVAAVERALLANPAISDASVNLATESASVEYDPEEITLEQIHAIIEETGYGVRPETERIQLGIGGMTCVACAGSVEATLSRVPGVESASVDLSSERAIVRYDPASATADDLVAAVESTGYTVTSTSSRRTRDDEEEEKLAVHNRNVKLAWALTIPIILWMIPEMIWGIMWPNHLVHNVGIILLASGVVFYPGFTTLRSAINAVRHGTANMDVLIFLGTTISLLTGPLSFLIGIANYAGVGGMIMAFHVTGRAIEARARGRASRAIKKLLELEAKTARVLIDGEEREVAVEDLSPGDIMVVRPGEKIPTDGEIIDGNTSVDQSMATGESMPVSKDEGEEVIGSTINLEGFVQVRATRVGDDTFLSQVVRLVEEAQGTRVPIQAIADQITAIFVPTILILATLTFLAWVAFPGAFHGIITWGAQFLPWINPDLGPYTLALSAMVATLVIACPCALGLATPTALMVGSGKGAEHGILIRHGEAIQTMREVAAIVFDKTGTITRGMPEVTEVVAADDLAEEEVLRVAAAAERGSEHPLGKAVVRETERRELRVLETTDFAAVVGRGVRAELDGETLVVGSANLLNESGIRIPDRLMQKREELENRGRTVILVARGEQTLGLIAVADTLKEDSRAALAELKRQGFRLAMITGDNRRTAEAVAAEVGIDRILADVLPDGKVQAVQKLQDEFGKVAMVGDGINDAPALAQADVGIAIGTGTDIAIESSDITLVAGDLSSVVTAVNVSRATFRKIRQNLFWAFAYNMVAIPVAIAGLLHPVIAEAAMALSSVSVVTNANLLGRENLAFKPDRD